MCAFRIGWVGGGISSVLLCVVCLCMCCVVLVVACWEVCVWGLVWGLDAGGLRVLVSLILILVGGVFELLDLAVAIWG